MKRLVARNENVLKIEEPISALELAQRNLDYNALAPDDFAFKYRKLAFRSVNVSYKDKDYKIQMNYCDNPYCKWYGTEQDVLDRIGKKTMKYRINGGTREKRYVWCNPDKGNYDLGLSMANYSGLVSNWSVALELQRLITINTVKEVTPDYKFHNDNCCLSEDTPMESPKSFKRRGESSARSQKWQCKECNKITNVLPEIEQRFNYNQKKNKILLWLFQLIVSRTPVKRICEDLKIAPVTYYNKLEWLYKKCLEFLEMHETKPLKKLSFNEIWIETDKLSYFVNNIRRPGTAKKSRKIKEDPLFPTFAVVSAEAKSKYVLRADISYDFEITLEDIENDTLKYNDDHLFNYQRKNELYRLPFCPQPPSLKDTETKAEYDINLKAFNTRKKYIKGLHLNSTYTAIAQFMILKDQINARNWRFITDEDYSLITPLYKVFHKEIKSKNAHHFLCKVGRGKAKEDSYNQWVLAMNSLRTWGERNGLEDIPFREIGFLKLVEDLKLNSHYKFITENGIQYPIWSNNTVEHPIPSTDEGIRNVGCTTDMSDKSPEYLASLLMDVSHHATNSFLQQVHRRLSILERPLVTARGDGKSYIYSNCNPKYAQYAITILRTYYNFCMPYGESKDTPAQALGIAKKRYEMEDIIYFK